MFQNRIAKAVCLALAVPALTYSMAISAQEENAVKEKTERIQITGSRIRSDSFGSESPIDIITVEEAEQEGLKTLGELLRTSTAAAGSSQLISALGVGFVTDGGAGTETVSLRGLGANRTLILLNGRRAGPAGTRGAVSGFDLNTIPLSTIERIEVLKDGASSLYGSDAVAGVINIITKKGDSKSVTLDISRPFESGGEEKRINISYGEEFSKGNFRVTADYRKTSELVRGDRDFLNCSERLIFSENGSRADPIDPRTGKAHCAESGFGIWLAPTGADNVQPGMQLAYDYDGFFAANGYESLNDTAVGTNDLTTPDGYYPVSFGGETEGWWDLNHPFRDNRTMSPQNETYSLFATGDYQLTDDILAYGEFIHSSRNTKQNSYRQFWNADIGFQPSSQYDGFDGDAYLLTVALTDHFSTEVTVDYTRAVIGATGSIGFWDWDVSYQNSHSNGEYKNDIILRDSMVMAQLNLRNDVTCTGAVTEFSSKTCVNVPWTDPDFLYGNQSPSVKNFLFGQDIGNTVYKQQTLEGYVSGDLYELPAGEIGAAFGFSIQKDEIDDTPGENTLNGNSWGLSGAGRTVGDQLSRALFAELRIPLIEDVSGIESLEATVSGRWTDVDTYGSDTTYKAGLNWVIFDGLSIRMNRGSSFRSPALFELFLSNQSGFGGQLSIDPCLDWATNLANGDITDLRAANCAADGVPEDYTIGGSSATLYTSGGAGRLAAETSVNENIGIVWTSPEDTYAISVDYYDVVIREEIATLGGSDITNGCYDSREFATEPLCDLIVRRDGSDNGDFGIDEVFGGYVNVASQVARGVDYNFTYQDEFDFGSIRLSVEHTMQIERTFKLFEDSEDNNLIGENGSPKHVGNVRLTYSKDDYSITWTSRYADAVNDYEYYANGNESSFAGEPITFVDEAPWTTYHSVSGTYNMESGLDLTVGIANLFDKEPPVISSRGREVGNAALYSQYDFVGRRFFANIQYNF